MIIVKDSRKHGRAVTVVSDKEKPECRDGLWLLSGAKRICFMLNNTDPFRLDNQILSKAMGGELFSKIVKSSGGSRAIWKF